MTYEEYMAMLYAKKDSPSIVIGGNKSTPRGVQALQSSIATPSPSNYTGGGGAARPAAKPKPKPKKPVKAAPIDPSTGMPILNQYVDETGDITGGFDEDGYGVIDVGEADHIGVEDPNQDFGPAIPYVPDPVQLTPEEEAFLTSEAPTTVAPYMKPVINEASLGGEQTTVDDALMELLMNTPSATPGVTFTPDVEAEALDAADEALELELQQEMDSELEAQMQAEIRAELDAALQDELNNLYDDPGYFEEVYGGLDPAGEQMQMLLEQDLDFLLN